MTAYLPPNLLALFAPRDPIPYIPPLDKLPHEKKSQQYIGVAQFMKDFEDPVDTPPPTRVETRDERKERKRKERQEQHAYKLEQELALWDPTAYTNNTSDPYKTLFVARINYDSSESKLRREFEVYGSIRKISVAHNQKTGKPRGYAFIEYEHERDMHSAYKHADGKKIDGRRVLVDVERSRTVKGWRPRRLGGGLGGTRKGGPDVNTKYSGRDDMGMRDDREDHERSRSPIERRERRRRSRSRDRGEERVERRRPRSRERAEREPRRPRRSRSRERRKSRERGGTEEEAPAGQEAVPSRGEREGGEEKERKRSRSRDRKRSRRSRSREKKRSRSRDRKRSRRSRSRDRSRRASRERKEGDAAGQAEVPPSDGPQFDEDGNVIVKEEKIDAGYDHHANNFGEYGDNGDNGNPKFAYNMQQQYADEDQNEEAYDQYPNGDADGETAEQ